MAFHVRDPETDRVVRELASTKGVTLTEAIRSACESALADAARSAGRDDLKARLKAIRDRVAAYPDNGVAIDKAFYDALNDE
ncbi:MAG: hypothetical protein DI565_06420 [Ancylobacter novellus]|uniref:Transcription factor n=1 Tax=Ancylobacter novellus TaxID=921 RepID=A0A2W5MB31_ANCNO|nr:MAG: hypothetical protein DI565_06420 [Ancylobacter novellus]